jgi:hypothetical protein
MKKFARSSLLLFALVCVGGGSIAHAATLGPSTLPNGGVGTAYSTSIQATGGPGPDMWCITSGSLPPGLSLTSLAGTAPKSSTCPLPDLLSQNATAKLSGTPTTAGTYKFTVTMVSGTTQDITEGTSQKASVAYTVTIVGLTLKVSATTVALGGTLTLTATVSGTTSLGLTWSVNGATNGSAAQGTLTACTTKAPLTCKYTAPSIDVPSPNPMTFKIVSTADSAATATTTATVTDSIAVTLTPASASVALKKTQVFTATISNSPKNTVLNWYVNGFLNGSTAQGTLGACTTTPAITCTYSAPPLDVPSPNPAVIKVASSADPGKYKTANVTVTDSIVVKITSPTLPQTVEVGHTLALTASLTGSTNTAVTWSVNGVTNGNSTYGTITGSGLTVSYKAPTLVPSLPTYSIKVASQADPSKSATLSVTISGAAACTSSGSESILSGQYAFSLRGFNASGFLAEIGSFTADGTGRITAGEVDSNGALGVQHAAITTSASSYSVGPDHRGCATIVTPFYSFTTRFALGTVSSGKATEGRLVEWEAPNSSAYIAAGRILQQTPASFSGGLSGSYAGEVAGVDPSKGRVGSVGVFPASSGSISKGELDMNMAGTLTNLTGVTGTYGSADANGRFDITLTAPSQVAGSVVGYMVSNAQFLYMTVTGSVLAGVFKQQSGTFSNSSFTGKMVFYMAGLNGGSTGGSASVGLASATLATKSLTMTSYYDGGGTWHPANTFTCTYSVAANGRTTLSGSTCEATGASFYLFAAGQGYALTPDTDIEIGQFDPQSAGPFSDTSLSAGTLCFGDLEVVNQDQGAAVATITLNGSGGLDMTSDYTSTTNQEPDKAISGTITVNSNGTFSNPTGGPIDGIIISNTRFVSVDNQTSAYPTIAMAKQ